MDWIWTPKYEIKHLHLFDFDQLMAQYHLCRNQILWFSSQTIPQIRITRIRQIRNLEILLRQPPNLRSFNWRRIRITLPLQRPRRLKHFRKQLWSPQLLLQKQHYPLRFSRRQRLPSRSQTSQSRSNQPKISHDRRRILLWRCPLHYLLEQSIRLLRNPLQQGQNRRNRWILRKKIIVIRWTHRIRNWNLSYRKSSRYWRFRVQSRNRLCWLDKQSR